MNFTTDVVIGLEIHIELNTQSKLFCGCTRIGGDPNTATCPTCLGMPGAKPRLNKAAVHKAMALCSALGCTIAPQIQFSRKTYFYPDLSKNYQTTQFEVPLGSGGSLELTDGTRVGIVRLHIEEDPAALVHPGSIRDAQYVLVDYNRSGCPLAELVTEPDMSSPAQARDFMKHLITLLSYLGVFDPSSCVIKADANVSIKESGYIRAEIKNVSGFKDIERALEYEIARQRKVVSEGEALVMETRGWDAETGTTFSMRTKETEADYGYILDPDLVTYTIDDAWKRKVQEEQPELPKERKERYMNEIGLSEDDARVLTQEYALVTLYEHMLAQSIDPVIAARWLRRELVRVLNYHSLSLEEVDFSENRKKDLCAIFSMLTNKEITDKTAQKLMDEFGNSIYDGTDFDPVAYVEEHDLKAMGDSGELEKFCAESLQENPKAVEDYKSGNDKALNFVVGSVMRKTKGKADPREINTLLKKLADSL